MGYLLEASLLVLLLAACRAAPAHSPVILLPGEPARLLLPVKPLSGPSRTFCCCYLGLAGSVLEAKLNRSEVPSFLCSKQHDWEVEWLSLKAALRPNCLLDELTITYDPATKRWEPNIPLSEYPTSPSQLSFAP